MKNGRGKDYGTGWDGRSRIPDETYKKNYDQIDWSSIKENENNKKKKLRKSTNI
jgi:hypothetical protein